MTIPARMAKAARSICETPRSHAKRFPARYRATQPASLLGVQWKSNRPRDRGTGFRPLPWPASTHVNRNSFFRDSESVRIAAHLGLVEVHLGYLAQRCAGRLAGLLTSRLLHSVSSHGT